MSQTKIEWTDARWNPVRGCSRVSEGCRNCYAERIAARFSGFESDRGPEHDDNEGLPFFSFAKMTASGPRWTGKVELIPSKLDEPLRWRKPRMVFVNSMSDLFHEGLGEAAVLSVFSIMQRAQHHTYQVLTKRAYRMSQVVPWIGRKFAEQGLPWPLPNVWLGVSVEDQATADERIPLLLQTPAALRFVSYEPALGPVDFGRFLIKTPCEYHPHPGDHCSNGLDQVIVGGESGPRARPMDLAWPRSARDQCREARVPFFMKQAGARPVDYRCPCGADDCTHPFDEHIKLKSLKGGDPAEWPEDLRVREFPA